MKKEVHPQYFPEAKVRCACGAEFSVGSTKEKIAVEICSHCHPFYTGKEKVTDTVGKVERFKKRRTTASAKPIRKKKEKVAAKRAKKAEKTATEKPEISK